MTEEKKKTETREKKRKMRLEILKKEEWPRPRSITEKKNVKTLQTN